MGVLWQESYIFLSKLHKWIQGLGCALLKVGLFPFSSKFCSLSFLFHYKLGPTNSPTSPFMSFPPEKHASLQPPDIVEIIVFSVLSSFHVIVIPLCIWKLLKLFWALFTIFHHTFSIAPHTASLIPFRRKHFLNSSLLFPYYLQTFPLFPIIGKEFYALFFASQ